MNEPTNATSATWTLLVVEDDMDLSSALTARLEHAGYRIETSHTGLGGLIKSRYLNPDLLLLDLGLPRVDGLELLRKLRTTPGYERVPVIIMTGSPDPGVDEQARALGVSCVLRKPFDSETLLAAIAASLTGPPQQAA